jgi:hypothetical protein
MIFIYYKYPCDFDLINTSVLVKSDYLLERERERERERDAQAYISYMFTRACESPQKQIIKTTYSGRHKRRGGIFLFTETYSNNGRRHGFPSPVGLYRTVTGGVRPATNN